MGCIVKQQVDIRFEKEEKSLLELKTAEKGPKGRYFCGLKSHIDVGWNGNPILLHFDLLQT